MLYGRDYWRGLLDWLHERVLADGMLGARDLDLVRLSDSPEEICSLVTAGGAGGG